MRIEIATAPCSWGVFYADGRTSNTPYPVFLSQASEAGYKKIELGPDGYLPQDIVKLKGELEKYKLGVCAGTATIPFGAMNRDQCIGMIEQLATRLNKLDCGEMVVMDGTLYGKDFPRKKDWTPEIWNAVYDNILQVNDYLKKEHGIKMVFHPHAGTAIEFSDEIDHMLRMGEIYLCFDTGHHVFSNGGTDRGDQTALDFMKENKDRIAYLHFKNVDGEIRRKSIEEGWSVMQAFMSQVMCDLEDGVIDFEQLRDVLGEIDFRGVAVIEQDMFKATTDIAFRTAKKNLEYLRRINMIE